MTQQNKLTELIEEYQAKLRDVKALERKYYKLKDLSEYSVCISMQEVVRYEYGVDEYATEEIQNQMATQIAEMLLKDGFVTFGESTEYNVFGSSVKVMCAYVNVLKKQ